MRWLSRQFVKEKLSSAFCNTCDIQCFIMIMTFAERLSLHYQKIFWTGMER